MAKKHYARDISAIQNAAKTLLANIRFASVDDPVRSVVITSTGENEGKSTVAMNLAQAVATSGKTVLLVECDMRRRSLADMLGVHGKAGLYAVLVGQATLDDAVVAMSPEGMFFLDAEPSIPSPSDILASKRFKNFLASAEEKYDYVIFDTPPVGAFVDAAVLSSLVDGTLVVVREDGTPRDAAINTVEQLKKADANILGTVMNFCDYTGTSYSYESYMKSGDKNPRSVGGSRFAGSAAGSGAAAGHAVPAGHGRRPAGHAVRGGSGANAAPAGGSHEAKTPVPATPPRVGRSANVAPAGKRFSK